jgi:hypothetical protein
MKAKHMTVKRDGLTFQNGESYLVVTTDDNKGTVIDMVKWPSPRTKNRPHDQSEMDFAVAAWFEQRHDEVFAESHKPHLCDERATMNDNPKWPFAADTNPRNYKDAKLDRTMIDIVKPDHVELEISADGKTVYVHVNGITAFRAGHIGELTLNDHRESDDESTGTYLEGYNSGFVNGLEFAKTHSIRDVNAELKRLTTEKKHHTDDDFDASAPTYAERFPWNYESGMPPSERLRPSAIDELLE